MAEHKWYVVRAVSGQEKKVKNYLELEINRRKMDELNKKRFIGSNITENRTYSINVRNQKKSSIAITILDQLPKSINSSITVEATELSGGIVNPENGEVKWELVLEPQSKKELTFGYEVKYPKRERIILD